MREATPSRRPSALGAPQSCRLFRVDREGEFLSRPNRFVVQVRCGRSILRAHCPNPGRMIELLHRGAPVVLERAKGSGRRLHYTLAAVRRGDALVPLVSERANDVAAELVIPRLYPNALGVRREVRHGGSRFDFLISLPDVEVFLEVKACTLIEEGLALFPDAPSLRAARHVRELASLDGVLNPGRLVRGAVLFVVFSPDALSFMPNVHCDPGFARAFAECAPRLQVHAVSVRTDPEGTARVEQLRLPIEHRILSELAPDAGVYLFSLELRRRRTLSVGALGDVCFEKGWYVYVGSARQNLSKRLARHGRRVRGKTMRWHIDFLRTEARAVRALPIRTRLDLECSLAQDLARISAGSVPGFGCSDCGCPSHLLRLPEDPAEDPRFVELLNRYRHRIALGR